MKNITLNSSALKNAIWTDKSGVQHFNFIKPIAIFEKLLYNKFLIQYFNLSMMYNDIIRIFILITLHVWNELFVESGKLNKFIDDNPDLYCGECYVETIIIDYVVEFIDYLNNKFGTNISIMHEDDLSMEMTNKKLTFESLSNVLTFDKDYIYLTFGSLGDVYISPNIQVNGNVDITDNVINNLIMNFASYWMCMPFTDINIKNFNKSYVINGKGITPCI